MALGKRLPRLCWGAAAPFLPWTDGTGRRWRGWALLPLAAPFIPLYLVLSWALFIPLSEPRDGPRTIRHEQVSNLVYHIPDLSENLPRLLLSLLTAPFLNHNSVQIVYVTILLLLFGVIFEAKEGTRRTVLCFVLTTIAAAIVAGILLHVLYPRVVDSPFFERAWNRTWSGGSAAAFGLMGAVAARARRPWPLLALFALWEINVAQWYLKEYTPAFHLTALIVGFLLARFLLRPVWGGPGIEHRGVRRRPGDP